MHVLLCRRLWRGLMLALVMCAPVQALAQGIPQQPKLTQAPPVWLGLLVMAVLLAIVLVVSLMPSKRSHQD